MTQSDERFERWLAEQAREVNAPPATPRDAMWSAISAQLAALPNDSAPVRRTTSRGWIPIASVAAIAAAIVLGVGIDRFMLRAPLSPVASPTKPIVVASAASSGTAPDTATIISAAPRVATTDRTTERPHPRAEHPAPGIQRTAPTDLYRVATVQMLAQAEVLLTSYRANEQQADAASMQRMGLWAKDVLSSTRLLIDSPVGDDKRLRPLLDDLELVLVQLVHVSGAPLTDVDRAAIDRTLREHDLLPRIRSAVPSGTSVPTV